MGLFEIIAWLLGVTFILGFLNYRYLRLPQTIGIMLIAMVTSLFLVLLNHLGLGSVGGFASRLFNEIDFNKTLMVGMLGFLLFAGALDLDISDLNEKKVEVAVFSVFSTILSMIIVGNLIFYLFNHLGLEISFLYALLFGALISPTDPVAVLSILKEAKAPKSLETKIVGESLFNDGVGVVLFLGIYSAIARGTGISFANFSWLFISESLGGLALGLLLGFLAFIILKKINNYQLEIIGTIALVMIVYSLALHLNMSGPIAIVAAGLLIGNKGRKFAMTEETRQHLYSFWHLADAILNFILFMLIGLEAAILKFSWPYLLAGLVAIPTVLFARYVSIALPVGMMKLFRRPFTRRVVNIMTWGGLRGGISVALVMSLPKGNEREILLAATYIIVIFSMAVQGLTIRSFVEEQLTAPSMFDRLKFLFKKE